MNKKIYFIPNVEIMSFEGDKSLCDGAMPNLQSLSGGSEDKPGKITAPERRVVF